MDQAAMLAAGYDRRDAGDEAGALGWFRRALTAPTASPTGAAEAWGALADSLSALGKNAESAEAAAKAAAQEPDRWHRWYTLAERHAAAGDTQAARTACHTALALRPDAAPLHALLGRLLLAGGETAVAAAALTEAWHLDGRDPDLAAECAQALLAAGDPLAAVELLGPVARSTPDSPLLPFRLGQAWAALGEGAKARSAWERCLAIDPADPWGATTALAGLNDTAPAAPDAVFIQALFDRYAERFDRDLVDHLHYQAPALLHALALTLPDLAGGGLAILDLGCGTGLSGLPFRPLARTLAGVDLSPRMLDQARRRALYDQLECSDITQALTRSPAAWDLLLAADVLNYSGDLEPVLAAAGTALKPWGLFLLTVEEAPPGATAPVLTPARRYRHPEGYVRTVAERCGFVVEVLQRGTLRTEKGARVEGLMGALRLSPSATPAPGE